MLRRLPSNRTILMTLYGTGVRRAELTRLRSATSIADAWSCTFRAAKAGKTDVMLSPVLLEELRAHWLPRPPRQRLPSDGFFERDASNLLSVLSTHPHVGSEKALASLWSSSREVVRLFL
jgi:integrase